MRHAGARLRLTIDGTRLRRAAALIALAIAGAVMGQDPLDDLPASPPMIGTFKDVNDPRRLNGSRVGPLVSSPIAPDELRSYALTLHLSEEQKPVVRDMYLTYRSHIDDLYREFNDPIGVMAYQAGAIAPTEYDWDYLKLITELREQEAHVDQHLIDFDRQMLAQIQTVLSPSQMDCFVRVGLRRERKRCLSNPTQISAGAIDLVELVEANVTDPAVLGDLDATLLEYERLITPLYERIDADLRKQSLEETRGLVAMRYSADGQTLLDPKSPEAQARTAEFFKNRPAMLSRTITEQEQLAAINRDFSTRVLALVPEPARSSMRSQYLMRAFPYIHPDRTDPTRMIEAMLAAEGLDPAIKDLMQARFDQWKNEYDAFTRSMEEHYVEYSRHFARTFTSEKEHTSAIRQARLDRCLSSEKAVKALMTLMPGDLQAKFDHQVELYLAQAKDFRQRETDPCRGNP